LAGPVVIFRVEAAGDDQRFAVIGALQTLGYREPEIQLMTRETAERLCEDDVVGGLYRS